MYTNDETTVQHASIQPHRLICPTFYRHVTPDFKSTDRSKRLACNSVSCQQADGQELRESFIGSVDSDNTTYAGLILGLQGLEDCPINRLRLHHDLESIATKDAAQ